MDMDGEFGRNSFIKWHKHDLPQHRSILTVPWIELGGNVSVKCPQTGYYAEIDFLTKPFYGGKRNRITAEVNIVNQLSIHNQRGLFSLQIFAPSEKKSFMSIVGEWSGLMEAKMNSDKQKSEVFVDVNSIPIFKKIVRPISEQDTDESRNIWKEVTAGLR